MTVVRNSLEVLGFPSFRGLIYDFSLNWSHEELIAFYFNYKANLMSSEEPKGFSL